jgi:hypothetical protein
VRTTRIVVTLTAVAWAVAAADTAAADDGQSAQEVIAKLQSEGYTVTIDKIGTAPLDECVVTNIRNPQQFTQLKPLLGGNQDGVLIPVVISQPISVSLDCSGQR